jgi:hypothetical protein
MNSLPFNGYKSIIGAIVIALSALVPGLSGLLLPLGTSLLGIGLAHKLEKLMEAIIDLRSGADNPPTTLPFPPQARQS